jgi:hypothetical protein
MSWEEGRVLLAQANVVVRLFVCCSFVVFYQIPHLKNSSRLAPFFFPLYCFSSGILTIGS